MRTETRSETELKVSNFSKGLPAGKSIVAMAKLLEHMKSTARDFVVPTAKLRMIAQEDSPLRLQFNDPNEGELSHLGFVPNRWAHSQVADYAGVPKAYYDRLSVENSHLLADNVNHGFLKKSERKRAEKPEARLVRTIDGQVRGFLSSSYRRLDGYDLMNHVLPIIGDYKMDVVSTELTEKRLYLKATCPAMRAEVKSGDEVMYGLAISSSDVGAGSVQVNPFLYRQICSNGLIQTMAFRKFHIGRNLSADAIQELLSEETKGVDDKAFWLAVRDVILGSLKPEVFADQVDRLRVAASQTILNPDPLRVVELSMKATGIQGEKNRTNIIAALASGNEGAGYTKWGLVNAFTRAANAEDIDYETSNDLQKAGGQILELAPTEWSRIASVA